MLKKWWSKIKSASKEAVAEPEIYSGVSGEPPSRCFQLTNLNGKIKAASTGPDTGIQDMLPCIPGMQVEFNDLTEWAYGRATSLYDVIPSSKKRSEVVRAGDPIADCFAVLSYEHHTVLVVADGVNWGQPAKRAARSAVLGVLGHLHKELPTMAASGQSPLETTQVFRHMLDALEPAQKLIISQFGTLTTLVMTVVARLALPIKRSSLKQASSLSTTSRCYHWVAMTVTVGDSSAFVYRQQEDVVEELTAAAHGGEYRDPRWTPGALGYASGEEPDLSNMTCSVTLLNHGDLVFLTSDGVADNFDPFLLKLARQAVERPLWVSDDVDSEVGSPDLDGSRDKLPMLNARQCHEKKMELLTMAVQRQRDGGDIVKDLQQGSGRTASASGGHRPALHKWSVTGTLSLGRSHTSAESSRPRLMAQTLVEGLLRHVTQETEEQRKWTERKQIAKEAARKSESRELPSLGTDMRAGSSQGRDSAPPGKMDHATVAAYLVGYG